ncbi:hypothetical protein BN873_470009 [Candidatus Competibacter denitrificans Run_A_D11]|uniref:Uncharacterized protein n=1 Tax=Candidatus Competibacter denitrificans Run_A_D11 TaxID=1400863 RepID=W6M6G1_9GAMM|nr:hypothetical protein BN873_470009 [Candidatus Competibacter denitrificans Run_A_D11]
MIIGIVARGLDRRYGRRAWEIPALLEGLL